MEFIVFADRMDKKLKFKLQNIENEVPPKPNNFSQEDLRMNFEKIQQEVKNLTTARL
tara:strand:+ start:912 stop:1082 length:171 start_codon:yes stop_codon:yes gene_type:complete